MSDDWLSLIQDWLPWVRDWGPMVISILCLLLLCLVLHKLSDLKERSIYLEDRSTYLEAVAHRDLTLVLLEPLAEHCERLKRGLTAVELAHRKSPYSAKGRAIAAEVDALLATRRDLQEQVRAASHGLDQLRGQELSRRCALLASLRQRTDQLIATIRTQEASSDSELQALRRPSRS